MYDFVMHDFSVYTGITKSCVISFFTFIPEKRKWRKIILLFFYVDTSHKKELVLKRVD